MTPEQENALARRVQHGVPLQPKPWEALASELELTPEQVLEQLQSWSEEGKLREISAVLEGSRLGYDSALVAGTVAEADIERVADLISQHPTVTHNYQRDHTYNLWFTIAVPPEMGLEATLDALAGLTGVEKFWPLRRTTTFKIGVNFDLNSRKSDTKAASMAPEEKPVLQLRDWERSLFRALQTPLPLVPEPFLALAESTGVDRDELLAFAREHHHHGGAIRRYVGTFRHRKLGVRGNGMGVWNIPVEQQPELGRHLAGAPEVSHCYAREAIPGFPYTVYSMIHGPDHDSCRAVMARLAGEIGIDDHRVLFSTREFKKTRLRYFLPELDRWWEANAPQECAS
jgi:siroheme decarboxylase